MQKPGSSDFGSHRQGFYPVSRQFQQGQRQSRVGYCCGMEDVENEPRSTACGALDSELCLTDNLYDGIYNVELQRRTRKHPIPFIKFAPLTLLVSFFGRVGDGTKLFLSRLL